MQNYPVGIEFSKDLRDIRGSQWGTSEIANQ